jgi:hypothetical protein
MKVMRLKSNMRIILALLLVLSVLAFSATSCRNYDYTLKITSTPSSLSFNGDYTWQIPGKNEVVLTMTGGTTPTQYVVKAAKISVYFKLAEYSGSELLKAEIFKGNTLVASSENSDGNDFVRLRFPEDFFP